MKKSSTYCRQDTFWSRVRVKGGYSINDMAVLLSCSKTAANNYFIGKTVPKASKIDILCEFFGVDKVKGEREFYEANKRYDANAHRPKVDIEQAEHVEAQLKAAQEFNERVKARTEPLVVPEPVEVVPFETSENVFKLVYGVLSYQEFNRFFDMVASKEGDALELIYGKVDFETYAKVASILKEG